MRRARLRNSILAVSGTFASLAAILFFNLGCPGGDLPSPPEPVVTVLVDPGSGTIVVGHTIQLNASTYKSGGLQVTGRTVTWSSADPSVATVSSAGLVTGIGAGGPIAITATSEGKSGSAQITVTPIPVASVTVTGPGSIARDATAQFTATPKDANGVTLTGRAVTWSSGNTGVASVSSSGVVTGVSEGGPVSIVATIEGITGSAQVTVTPLPVNQVTVAGPASVQVNSTAQMSVFLLDTHGNTVTGSRVVTWSSSLPAVASVSGTGQVTGVSVGGPVTITATSEGKSGSASITVVAVPNPTFLTGRVIDYESQIGISGARVSFIDDNSSTSMGSTITGADGSFTSPALSQVTGPVTMSAEASGYTDGRVLVASVPLGVTTFVEPIPLVPRTTVPGGISGTVRNARTGQGIPSAGVDLFDNFVTTPVAHVVADANGVFTFNGVAAGTYRLVGSATGYQPAVRVGVAVGHNTVTSGQDLVLSPTGTNDIRIVLTWGSAPSDLDSHLTGPNADATRFHVYYSTRGNLTSPPFAYLDIDDVSAFGPETITITQFNSGNYRYSVHDYSNRSSTTSTALGHSSAKVEVYTSTGLVQTFFVPNGVGTLWTVFEMTGSIANPVFTPRNQMDLVNDPSTILSPPADGTTRATDGVLIGRAVQQHPKAKPQ